MTGRPRGLLIRRSRRCPQWMIPCSNSPCARPAFRETANRCHAPRVQVAKLYKGEPVDCDLIPNVIVERTLLLEIKAVQAIHPLHQTQLLTYLRISGLHATPGYSPMWADRSVASATRIITAPRYTAPDS
jgi:hypothetical protein